MASILPSAKLTRGELRMLGDNVLYAVDHDGQDLSAVNRSIAVHGEDVDELFVPFPRHPVGKSSFPRPAA